MSKETGGPAFPTENERQTGNTSWHYEGMTLRDYFAAKAMQSYLMSLDRDTFPYDQWAVVSYEMADAMIAERNK